MKEQNLTIAKNIAVLRKRLAFTQEQVTTYLNINRTQLSYYETGKREVPFDLLEKIADLYHVDLYDLITDNINEKTMSYAFTFKANKLSQKDIENITKFNKIVRNYMKMKRLSVNIN